MGSPRFPLIAGFTVAAVVLYLISGSGDGPRSAAAQGNDFFTSTPGPLAKEHASLDNQNGCNDCHVDGTKAVDSNKCLDCHDHQDLRARIRAGKGYHASSKVRGKACATCHVDHEGRNFDIMGWRTVKGGMKGFDHKLTGWPLRDKHAVLECEECHENTNSAGRRTFLGEDKVCGSCHKRDQPHGFDRRALMQCERCHTEISWKPEKPRLDFDHNKKSDAEFPQEGAHRDVSCGKCHPKARFNLGQSKPGNCGNSGCHASPHEGMLFDKKSCDWCHSPKFRTLKQIEFNHRARTRFDLAGAHSEVECYTCHTDKRGFRKPSRSCATCHAADNPHRNRFEQFGKPPACETCHPESSFKPTTFRHGRHTKFDLTGKHARLGCRECHRGKQPFQFENFQSKQIRNDRNCMSCHEHENVHQRKFVDTPPGAKPVMRDGQKVQTCLECHEMAGKVQISREAVEPIHGVNGRWPLTRKHKGVDCAQCHPNDEFVDTPKQCGAVCHEDSLHEGTLGDACDACHEPGRWEAVRFDHSDNTTWPLLGLHATVPTCDDCHPDKSKYHETPTTCASVGCHAQDDVHNGALGDACDTCHVETGEMIFDHNTQSDYVLDGAHLTTRCSECHASIEFKPTPKTCFGGGACHPEPEIHEGQFGTVCETCHNTTTFADIEPLHDVGSFSLRGAHDRQPCQRCHLDSRPLAGSGNFCINCHRQDDVHANSLSPRCGECHTQWSFAPATFDHTRVGCNLTGLHRTLPCADCHQRGNFGGLSPTCFACHKDDAVARPTHQLYVQCASCHGTTMWQPTAALPAVGAGVGRESICR